MYAIQTPVIKYYLNFQQYTYFNLNHQIYFQKHTNKSMIDYDIKALKKLDKKEAKYAEKWHPIL